MEFNIADIRVHFLTRKPLDLQKYIMQNGASKFPVACRDSVCRYPSRNCLTCNLNIDCHYHLVFSQQLSSDPAGLKRHQKPPLPFAFSFPVSSEQPESLYCRLVVAGVAISALEMLLQGLVIMIESEKYFADCTVDAISSTDYYGTETQLGTAQSLLKHKNSLILLSYDEISNNTEYMVDKCTLQIVTPLKQISDKHVLNIFSFSLFFRSVMRRISAMGFYYAGYECKQDHKELSQIADKIICTPNTYRYSFQEGLKIAGITGTGILHGEIGRLIPILNVGSYFNTGKGSTYGRGYYKLY